MWGMVLKESYFDLIRDAGFDLVRIPIRWSAHAQKVPPYPIDEAFGERVDWAVDQALSRGLVTVINVHHYDEIMEDPAAHRERFLSLWRQIAHRYRDRGACLWFELLNEPHDRLEGGVWNALVRDAVAVVRESNPERVIVVGPGGWNSIKELRYLDLPDDPHLVVTVHYYSPFHFTHQGAEWVSGSNAWLGTKWLGTAQQRHAVEWDFRQAARWAREHDRRVFLGEFGAYSKADQASRVRWTAFVARTAESQGFAWAYWEFGAGFGVYDRGKGQWREDLLRSLIPQK